MLTFLMVMSLLSTFMFMFMTHPLSLGLILLTQTFLVALITGTMNLTYWFSYILFIIMVGGMLVLFMYMTSVASNEKFKSSYKLMILFIPVMLMMMTLLWEQPLLNTDLTPESIEQSKQILNEATLSKFMNWPSNQLVMTMIMYLLITLIAVVKITNITKGPLRQMF